MPFAAFAAPLLIAAASVAGSIALALPTARPGRPATVLLLPGHQQSVLAAVTNLDPDARLLGIGAGGLLLAIEYSRPDLPAQLKGTGVIAVIGAGTIGCHS